MYETKVALDSDNIRLSVPLMKVDKARRVVHGFATLDNIDKQDDIVTRQASIDAFTRFRGNIREQHDSKKAVGRVVDFKEDSVFDQETGKSYSGVFVSAYVSKGAEDTWQKVLDGTLSGFSIGGAIKETDVAYNEELDKSIRVINQYDLLELSLVDNPANQLANVVHIEKVDGKMTMDTPLVKGGIQNIFWCDEDGLILLKASDTQGCVMCQGDMQNIGFVESNDPQKEDVIKASVIEFKKNLTVKEATSMEENEDQIEKSETNEEITDEVIKSEEAAVEVEEESVEKTDEADEEVAVEKSEEVEEEVQEEPVEKTAQIEDILTPIISGMSALADAVTALDGKIAEMSKSLGAVSKDVSEVKAESDKFGKRVEAVEETTAFKKSGDLGEVVQEKVQKQEPLWGGRFLNSADL